MRFLSTLIILCALGYGVYWVNNNQPELKYKALEMINTGTIHALEANFSAKQIMDREELAAEPHLKFHPYLLMEVKYTTRDLDTEEGVILWDLIYGEMVIDTRTWDTTHGFADCINANADRHEYKILMTIAQNRGRADKLTLMSALNLEESLLDSWIERAKKKKLIVQQGTTYRIHLHQPLIDVKPSTYSSHPFVTKSFKHSERIPSRYSSRQIIRAAEAAFGTDFAIRNSHEVYLPIYSISLKKKNGSRQTTHWNGLNGKRIYHSNLIE
ncbi:MAG: hypothetical protein K1060chlam2_01368 [Chlamydiae bacterium]|nr:hypothetical protein [Chlamydiota bacterium]